MVVQAGLDIDWDGLPSRIRRGMRQQGLSYRVLASEVGVSPQTITNWLNGGRIQIGHVSRLAKALGMTTDEVLRGPDLQLGKLPASSDECERAIDLLGRLASLRNELEKSVPQLMDVLRDAEELARPNGT
jgi:transcriptional regulator with XRE-family HTH domain